MSTLESTPTNKRSSAKRGTAADTKLDDAPGEALERANGAENAAPDDGLELASKDGSGLSEPMTFPAQMTLINETAAPYTVARKHLAPGTSTTVAVRDESHLQRIKTDIKHLLAIQDHYKGREIEPLRIESTS